MIELPNLNIELTEVANLPFDKLKHMYVYLFNRTVNSSRREFFIWRITYRLQELRFGGLDTKTIKVTSHPNILNAKEGNWNEEMLKLLQEEKLGVVISQALRMQEGVDRF